MKLNKIKVELEGFPKNHPDNDIRMNIFFDILSVYNTSENIYFHYRIKHLTKEDLHTAIDKNEPILLKLISTSRSNKRWLKSNLNEKLNLEISKSWVKDVRINKVTPVATNLTDTGIQILRNDTLQPYFFLLNKENFSKTNWYSPSMLKNFEAHVFRHNPNLWTLQVDISIAKSKLILLFDPKNKKILQKQMVKNETNIENAKAVYEIKDYIREIVRLFKSE